MLGDRLLERDYLRLRARLLTLQGDPESAAAIASALVRDSRSHGGFSSRTFQVELTTLVEAILQCSPDPIDVHLLDELERTYTQMPTRLLADWPVLVLCSALDRSGRHDDARRIVQAYLPVRRGGPIEQSGLLPWIPSI